MAPSCGRVRGEEAAPLRACGVEHSMMRIGQGREIKEVRDVPTRAYGKASAARRGAFLAVDGATRSAPPATVARATRGVACAARDGILAAGGRRVGAECRGRRRA
ncbi:hypothetical protein BE04_27365 [Sorangium cellulosum]|uniref:Uncharacterized protein n=1 Tax=Sorangium cellulosum TaxID=56 RepID=A0A150PKA2_SORCE|nr:hypothetical protein BE04_27365 [Sorangium cellulosum]